MVAFVPISIAHYAKSECASYISQRIASFYTENVLTLDTLHSDWGRQIMGTKIEKQRPRYMHQQTFEPLQKKKRHYDIKYEQALNILLIKKNYEMNCSIKLFGS